MNLPRKTFLLLLAGIIIHQTVLGQIAMTNVYGRKITSLNGKWKAIIDPLDVGIGDWTAIYKEKKATGKKDFVEYSFDLSSTLDVPGDFNSQLPELNYFESSVWYKKTVAYKRKENKRTFFYFGAVNYKTDVFLNGEKIGNHEGGFTPFQFEVTGSIKDSNSLIVRTNNARAKDGIPATGFDWFNYGGITRDVFLIETPETFIEDYFIQLKKNNSKLIEGYIQLNGSRKNQQITISIPEINLNYQGKTNETGRCIFQFPIKLQLWSPENPKLYSVLVMSETDTVREEIGFRTIQVSGTEILLNGKSVFLKGVNIHEEIPQRRARAYSEADALVLLNWAKELGCNFVRLAHYPHNEYTIRLAEKMGLMVWEELPIYQHIDFKNPVVKPKMNLMLEEMIHRDQNRCGVVIWSLSNETYPSTERHQAIVDLAIAARLLDNTRLISSAFNVITYKDDKAIIDDKINEVLDVLAVNEYVGWYKTWPKEPGEIEWSSPYNKPLIMSEFGGEAMFGNKEGQPDMASGWTEEYQEQIYKDQIKMLKKIPFLRGTCPWVLVDFRSPVRMHPKYQNGWNRKGLLSDRGDKKKAWYIYKDFRYNFVPVNKK
jgi:beta-glucuronidase